MARSAQPLIRPKQINLAEWPNPRDFANYIQIVKELSAAGFVWDPNDHAWHRKRDDGAMSDEAIEDVARLYPVLMPAIVKAIQTGSSGFNIINEELPDGSWQSRFVPQFNVVDALAGIA